MFNCSLTYEFEGTQEESYDTAAVIQTPVNSVTAVIDLINKTVNYS